VTLGGSFHAGHFVPNQDATLHEDTVIPCSEAVSFVLFHIAILSCGSAFGVEFHQVDNIVIMREICYLDYALYWFESRSV
jgi:hypothetical protein